MNSPLVSVILPVYNGSKYLRPAVESILRQTYENFEFIIINDGSTDDSAEILRGIKDRRIRLYDQQNKGLAGTLNVGIDLARGTYIARMDQDDLALPLRIAKQVDFLEKNPRCSLLGTQAEIWVGDEKTDRSHEHPTDNLSLKFELMFDNYFVHSSVMLRKSTLVHIGGYATDKSRQPPEDYELWSRIARKYNIANLPERLMIYREVEASMSRITVENPFLDKLIMIGCENIAHTLGYETPSVDIVDTIALMHSAYNRLSRNPSIKRICNIVQNVGNKINTEKSLDLSRRVNQRILTLKHKYITQISNVRRFPRFIQVIRSIKPYLR